MKKFFLVSLVLCLLVLSACGTKAPEVTSTEPTTEATTEATEPTTEAPTEATEPPTEPLGQVNPLTGEPLEEVYTGRPVSFTINKGETVGVVGGGIVYYIVYNFVILLGLKTDYLKMLSAVIVALFLGIPYLKAKFVTKTRDLHAPAAAGGDSHA